MADLVRNKEHLITNFKKIEYYLKKGTANEKKEMGGYISRGVNFVRYSLDGDIKFAPSRFIGYQNNNLIDHVNNWSKNGVTTTKKIRKIFEDTEELPNEIFEEELRHYCEKIGSSLQNRDHKFWILNEKLTL